MRSQVTSSGSSRRWRMIRMAAIRRAAFTCGRCGGQFTAQQLEVHHLHGRELGDGAPNLQCLCRPCHAAVEGRV